MKRSGMRSDLIRAGRNDGEHPDDSLTLVKFVQATSVEGRSIQRQGLLNNFEEEREGNLI